MKISGLRLFRPIAACLLLWLTVLVGSMTLVASSSRADELSALAKLQIDGSSMEQEGDGLRIRLQLSQAVPWRLRVLDQPPRLVIDTRRVDWTGTGKIGKQAPVKGLRAGSFRPGWSRLVLELEGPQRVATAEMTTETGAARIDVLIVPTDAESFAVEAARPDLPEWATPSPASLAPPLPEGEGAIVVVLDPGHGGIDPGAEKDDETEAALMLTFARELKEVLLRDGRFKVVLTRDEDTFVPLETRTSIAREAGADIFLSLHADALAEGDARGATVYTLAEEASDAASAALAERHDRDDLLAGIDLTAQDDLIAQVLMEMARTETAPRTERLAKAIVGAIKAADIRMHRSPQQVGGFSVLKSPDIPSVLLELGFLSSDHDHKRLTDPAWRSRMADAVLQALLVWAEEDVALRAADAP